MERGPVDFDLAACFSAIALDAGLPVADFRAAAFFAVLLSADFLAAGLFAAAFFAGVLDTGVLRALTDFAGLLREELFFAAGLGVVDFRFVAVALRVFVTAELRGETRSAVRRVLDLAGKAFRAADFFVATFFVATFFVVFFVAGLLGGVFFDARLVVGLALRDAVGLMRFLQGVGSDHDPKQVAVASPFLPSRAFTAR